jgi:hypothetical protein
LEPGSPSKPLKSATILLTSIMETLLLVQQ